MRTRFMTTCGRSGEVVPKRTRGNHQYTKGGKLVYHMREGSKSLPMAYLKALACAPEVFASGHIESIPAFRTAKFYNAVVKTHRYPEEPKDSPPALEFSVEDPMVVAVAPRAKAKAPSSKRGRKLSAEEMSRPLAVADDDGDHDKDDEDEDNDAEGASLDEGGDDMDCDEECEEDEDGGSAEEESGEESLGGQPPEQEVICGSAELEVHPEASPAEVVCAHESNASEELAHAAPAQALAQAPPTPAPTRPPPPPPDPPLQPSSASTDPPAPARRRKQPAASASKRTPVVSQETYEWCCQEDPRMFRFTYRRPEPGVLPRWQVLCRQHADRCTVTTQIPVGQEAFIESCLRWWASRAHEASSKAEHRALWTKSPSADLPTAEEVAQLGVCYTPAEALALRGPVRRRAAPAQQEEDGSVAQLADNSDSSSSDSDSSSSSSDSSSS